MTGRIKTLPHIGEYTKPGCSRGISLSDGDCSTEEDKNITEIRRNQAHRLVTEEWDHSNERKQGQRTYHAETRDNSTHSRHAAGRGRARREGEEESTTRRKTGTTRDECEEGNSQFRMNRTAKELCTKRMDRNGSGTYIGDTKDRRPGDKAWEEYGIKNCHSS